MDTNIANNEIQFRYQHEKNVIIFMFQTVKMIHQFLKEER